MIMMAVTVSKVTVMTIMVTNDGSDDGRDGEDSGGDGGHHNGSDDGDDEGPRGQKSLFTDVCPALRMEADTTHPLH